MSRTLSGRPLSGPPSLLAEAGPAPARHAGARQCRPAQPAWHGGETGEYERPYISVSLYSAQLPPTRVCREPQLELDGHCSVSATVGGTRELERPYTATPSRQPPVRGCKGHLNVATRQLALGRSFARLQGGPRPPGVDVGASCVFARPKPLAHWQCGRGTVDSEQSQVAPTNKAALKAEPPMGGLGCDS
jgi:hypothetical protein